MSELKFKISYNSGKKSFTFSKIKSDATDQKLYNTGLAFARLRSGDHDNIFKVVETDITDAQA